jgi:hypothetical protein
MARNLLLRLRKEASDKIQNFWGEKLCTTEAEKSQCTVTAGTHTDLQVLDVDKNGQVRPV